MLWQQKCFSLLPKCRDVESLRLLSWVYRLVCNYKCSCWPHLGSGSVEVLLLAPGEPRALSFHFETPSQRAEDNHCDKWRKVLPAHHREQGRPTTEHTPHRHISGFLWRLDQFTRRKTSRVRTPAGKSGPQHKSTKNERHCCTRQQ